MHDPRIDRLAEVLVTYSTAMKPGEHLLIEAFDIPDEMVVALVRETQKAGAHPHVALRRTRVLRALDEGNADDAFQVWGEIDLNRMQKMDAYLGVRGSDNASEGAGIAPDRVKAKAQLYSRPVHFEERVNRTRWCVLRWPSPSMAQLAEMSTDEFEDFYFRVCTLDYAQMDRAAQALKTRMEATDRVRIHGPGDTDLTFSIKGIPAIPCSGDMNIPDGETFTAPVRESVNGVIHYNTPTIYNGVSFKNVRLEFKDGRIVNASADSNHDELQHIFDTDEGARYVGEFAIGYNPYILEPMKDILFDEKIAGSIHFTPGRCYEEASNGNVSEIHWDLVLIQRHDYGGGTLEFDGEVVRRDGLFVVPDLEPLNPASLGAE